MKRTIAIASAIIALMLASGSASAQQVYAGQLEATRDTSGGHCGESPGDHDFFMYRASVGAAPASIFISSKGTEVIIQSADPSGEFDLTGADGTFTGTLLQSSNGPSPWLLASTIKSGTYTITTDATDPDMVQVTKMVINFKIKESGQKCSFIWNGVMTPALMPPG